MASARIRPFCRKHNFNIGCFDGTKINPGKITQRNISLFIYNIHFCLIWKSSGISFNKAIEELKMNCTFVDNVISDKHVKSLLNMNINLKKFNLN